MDRPQATQAMMGQRLAARALALAGAGAEGPRDNHRLDLTRLAEDAPPPRARAAAKDALDRGETHYTSRPGIAPLRQAIAARSSADGFPVGAGDVIVTNGGAEALYIALQSILTPGERLLVGGPVAPNVRAIVAFIGAETVQMQVEATSRFVPDSETIARSGARVLLLASPSPVTGVAVQLGDLERLLAAARSRDMTVILDRSLAWCCYNPAAARFRNPDVAAAVVTIGSFSVSHGMDGWRVGYLAAPVAQGAAARALKESMSICTSAVSQFAALAAIDDDDEWLDERRRMFASRRDRAVERLRAAGIDVVMPDAWAPLLIAVDSIDPDDRRVAERLRETGVLVDPGSAFGPATRGFIRVDLRASNDALAAGIERIARLRSRSGR